VVEGSIRKRGHVLRINAQLVDAANGVQLWAETYNRELGDGGPFETLDEVADRVVATVADGHGVLVRSMATATREKPLEEASASQLVSRWFTYVLQLKAEEHSRLRAAFERVLDRQPNHADAWACLSNLYCWEYVHRLNPLERPMERALEAAWRAVTIDPACQLGWQQLAEAHFFAKDYTAFGDAAERAMALNPRNSHTRAYLGLLIAFSGEWERGLALVQRAMALNPHYPDWCYLPYFYNHYRKGEYRAALQVVKKINMPEDPWPQMGIAAACGQLNHQEMARAAIELVRKHQPLYLDLKYYREDAEKWFADTSIVEQLLQGLRKVGLKDFTDSSE
jgi:adenylate cyclase